jgi:hypothetical protein
MVVARSEDYAATHVGKKVSPTVSFDRIQISIIGLDSPATEEVTTMERTDVSVEDLQERTFFVIFFNISI